MPSMISAANAISKRKRVVISTSSLSYFNSREAKLLSRFSSSQSSQSDCLLPGQTTKNIQSPSQWPNMQKNIRLEAIKSSGLTQLHHQTQDVVSRSRESLFEREHFNDQSRRERESVAQIKERTRLESAIKEALAHYSARQETFSIRGDCIDVLGVEVSADLRLAKVYWCLPYSLDLRELPPDKLELVITKMQQILNEKGGRIQALVHTRLRAYYPPRLQWVAAEHISKDFKHGFSLANWKKK